MRTITEEDLKLIDLELASKRKEFDIVVFNNLDEKLNWLREFFNSYVPILEKRFLTEEEMQNWVFLPNEIRIKFYLYFPEHGLNMANYSQDLAKENAIMRSREKSRKYSDLISLRHND